MFIILRLSVAENTAYGNQELRLFLHIFIRTVIWLTAMDAFC